MDDRIYFDARAEIELSDADRATVRAFLETLADQYDRVGLEAHGDRHDVWCVTLLRGNRWVKLPTRTAFLCDPEAPPALRILIALAAARHLPQQETA